MIYSEHLTFQKQVLNNWSNFKNFNFLNALNLCNMIFTNIYKLAKFICRKLFAFNKKVIWRHSKQKKLELELLFSPFVN